MQGLPPKRSAFVMQALLSTHFRTGAYYPVGGSSRIAATIIPLIKAAGGDVLVRAPVSALVMNDDGTRVIGVTVRGHRILAPLVISATGVLNTYTKLFPTNTNTNNTTTIPSTIQSHVEKVRKCLIHRPYYPDIHTNTTNTNTEAGVDMNRVLEPSCAMFTLFVGMLLL